MEVLNGGDLLFHLRKLKTFNENQVKFYSAQILCGIQYLHSKGIVHR
jgi:serine/threonine protein kinase